MKWKGLTAREVEESRAKFGSNTLTELRLTRCGKKSWRGLKTP